MSDLQEGDEFAGHRIERVIGRGGMGVVYSAREDGLNRTVALKVMHERFAADPGNRWLRQQIIDLFSD